MIKIVIAPYQMHKNLLKMYRQKDVFVDVKTISKEELLGQYYGKVRDESVSYLLKNYKYSYDDLQALLPFIPYINKPINDYLTIKNDLESQHLLIKNNYLKQFFLNNEVYIYGYSKNDRELITILDALDVKYNFVINEPKNNSKEILRFETEFDEVFSTLNSIAALLKQGVDVNKIYIFVSNDEYLYSLNEFSPDFGYKIDDGKSYSFYITPLAGQFLSNYIASKDVNLAKQVIADCSNVELRDDLIALIDGCTDDEMVFQTQLDYFIGEFKTTKVARKVYKDVVKIINKPIYEEDAHVFVLGFAQGIYPAARKDNELISDKDKVGFGLNSSLEDTQVIRDTLIDFFYSNNHFYYSFAERSLTDKYFISPLVSTLGLQETKAKLAETIYSQKMAEYFLAKLLDLKEFYREDSGDLHALQRIIQIPYGEYDNSFTGVSVMNENMSMKLSYSSINDYFMCPFKYYVSNILKVDPFEGNFYTKLGNVVHKIFELHNNADFDFDKVFSEEVTKQNFTIEELPIVNNIKQRVLTASNAIKIHQTKMIGVSKILTEKEIVISIGKKSVLKGKIDKSIIFDNQSLVIVDYKTGDDSFNPKYIEYGAGLQLPTYCLLVKSDDELKDLSVVGLFINNVINNQLTYGTKEGDLINPYYRLNGQVDATLENVQMIDSTVSGIEKGTSQFIKSLTYNKGKLSTRSNTLASTAEFDGYAEVALRKYLEADTNIRHNEFSINPLYPTKSNNACMHCNYKDICFVKSYQKRYLYVPTKDDSEDDENEL